MRKLKYLCVGGGGVVINRVSLQVVMMMTVEMIIKKKISRTTVKCASPCLEGEKIP